MRWSIPGGGCTSAAPFLPVKRTWLLTAGKAAARGALVAPVDQAVPHFSLGAVPALTASRYDSSLSGRDPTQRAYRMDAAQLNFSAVCATCGNWTALPIWCLGQGWVGDRGRA